MAVCSCLGRAKPGKRHCCCRFFLAAVFMICLSMTLTSGYDATPRCLGRNCRIASQAK